VCWTGQLLLFKQQTKHTAVKCCHNNANTTSTPLLTSLLQQAAPLALLPAP
jgi:hypothetical protein